MFTVAVHLVCNERRILHLLSFCIAELLSQRQASEDMDGDGCNIEHGSSVNLLAENCDAVKEGKTLAHDQSSADISQMSSDFEEESLTSGQDTSLKLYAEASTMNREKRAVNGIPDAVQHVLSDSAEEKDVKRSISGPNFPASLFTESNVKISRTGDKNLSFNFLLPNVEMKTDNKMKTDKVTVHKRSDCSNAFEMASPNNERDTTYRKEVTGIKQEYKTNNCDTSKFCLLDQPHTRS